MDENLVIVGGVVLTIAVLVLFIQVAFLNARMESVEENINSVNSKVEENTKLLKGLSKSLDTLSGNLQNIKKDLLENKRKTSLLWEEVLAAQKEVLNLKEAKNLPVPPLESQFVTVVIARGDTLKKISDAFELGEFGVDLLVSLNGIKNPNSIYVGEKIKLPVQLKSRAVLPIKAKITKDLIKKGFDESGWVVFNVEKVPVLSALPGRVDEVKKGYVRIYHGNGVYTSYKWSGKIYVKKGEWVRAGEEIGYIEEKPLYFALLVDGEPRDPFRVIFSYFGNFNASFYTEWEDGVLPEQATFKLTRSGELAQKWWTIAADPNVIPLGSFVYIPEFSRFPNGGLFRVQDTGGFVKGKRIDIYIGDLPLALSLAKREVKVYVLYGN